MSLAAQPLAAPPTLTEGVAAFQAGAYDRALAVFRPLAEAGDPEAQARLERRAAQHTLASAGLGLGGGLAFAAAVALLRTRIDHQRQLQPSLGLSPGGLGVGVSGHF